MESNHTIQQDGNEITFWNDSKQIGIRFQKGDFLCRYTHEIVLTDASLLSTPEKLKLMEQVVAELIGAAAIIYPNEFSIIKH